MFRLRDHIISLVAVFLALGLGILIGTGLSEDMLVTQQRLLIEQLTADFRSMREERNQLEAKILSLNKDLSLWDKYQNALYPAIVTGLLEDRKIGIICLAADIPQGVMSLLADADAMVVTVIHVADKAKPGTSPKSMGQAVTELLAASDEPDNMVASALAGIMESGYMTIGQEPSAKPDTLLLFVGDKEAVDAEFIHELIAGAGKASITLVGLETSEVRHSLLGELKRKGASTIDNADTVFGQFSLLSVLRGNTGSFGVKDHADEFIATF